MKVSIVPNDEFIYLDGKAYHVPSVKNLTRFQAIQWDGEEGHVEYVQSKGEFLPNEKITTIQPFQQYITEALKLAEEGQAPAPLMPLPMFAYRTRQQIAFTQAKTADFGVQYSDPVTIGLLTSLVALYDKGALTGTLNYKGPNGFITLTQQELEQLSFQIAAHVQKAFSAEKSVLEDIEMGTITTHQQIVTAFAAAMAR